MRIAKIFFLIRDYITGDFAYKKFCEHHKKTHPHQKIPDKKDFLRSRQKAKWQKINRCC